MAQSSSTPAVLVPQRQDLLNQLAAANRWGRVGLAVQAVMIAGLATWIDWPQVVLEPWLSVFAIAVIVGPFAMEIARFWAQQKKEIGDLKEQTRFGEFDKHRLRALFQDTLRRLKLPETRLPVFIVANRFSNAASMHVGLGSLFRSINGIYLHRQALHKLTAEEVQDIMGHELGHFYRYYLVSDRFRFIPLAVGCLACLVAVQVFGLNSLFSMLVLMVTGSLIWKFSSLQTARHIWCIEYLCDDLGAQVHSVAVSVSGLMKLGAEAEVMTAIQQQAARSANRGNLNAHEVVEAIASAVPYGHATGAEIEAAVHKSLKARASQGPSLGGFLHYMWNSDVDAAANEEFEKQIDQLANLQTVPRIPWEKLLADPTEIKFNEQSLEALVALIEQFPQAELFHIPEALGNVDPLHPPLKQRIVFLWQNRREIERAASQRH